MESRGRPGIRVEDSQLERISNYPDQIALLEEGMKDGTDADVTKSRMRLCEMHSDWIIEDPEAAATGNSVNRLWQKCFYERIALARKMIAKNKKKRIDSVESEQSLKVFLNEGVTLMGYIIDRLKNRMITKAQEDDLDNDSTSRFGGVQCLARLYICLGDLYRYNGKLDEATSSYHNASSLAPGMSHCFNQLAVVSDCKESTAVATYWYVRAIYSGDNVAKAEANLHLQLSKNRSWLIKQDQAAPILASTATKLFVSKFVDLYYAGVLQEPIDPKTVLNCVNSFQTLLASSAFSDPLLCKLIVILAAKDTYIYDFGLCLFERVVVMLDKKATRRTLVPALLLLEYLLIKPDSEQREFWKNAVSVWNTIALQDIEDQNDATTIKEYVGLKGFKPFEPFIGKLSGYFLSEAAACAQFDKTQTEAETASARILRFRTLKPALLLLECIVESPNGSLLFQEPSREATKWTDDNLDAINYDSVIGDESLEFDEGEDIVLDVPMPVQPASKKQAMSSSPMRPVVTAPIAPIGVVAPMVLQPTKLPILSGHVVPFQTHQQATFEQEAGPSSKATIGPPPGFGGTPMFGHISSVTEQPNWDALFPMSTTTANPFIYGDVMPPPNHTQQAYANAQQEQSSRLKTDNPFAM